MLNEVLWAMRLAGRIPWKTMGFSFGYRLFPSLFDIFLACVLARFLSCRGLYTNLPEQIENGFQDPNIETDKKLSANLQINSVGFYNYWSNLDGQEYGSTNTDES